jgi:starch synthase (maltosyl-transferring)
VAVDGRIRAVIESVLPEIDAGRFPIKRVVGETVVVEADAFADGHDAVRCVLRYRHCSERDWNEVEMAACGNDRFQAEFRVEKLGQYRYSVAAWVDRLLSWRREFARRVEDERFGGHRALPGQPSTNVANGVGLGVVALRGGGMRYGRAHTAR